MEMISVPRGKSWLLRDGGGVSAQNRTLHIHKAQIYIQYINRYTIICGIKISLEEAIMKKMSKRLWW